MAQTTDNRQDNESLATGRRDFYLGFTADEEDAAERALARFIERFGCKPAEVMPAPGGILLVGPIPSPLSLIGRGAGGEGASPARPTESKGQLSLI